MSAPDFDADTLASLDKLAERGYMLGHYLETAATIMQSSYTPAGARPGRKADSAVVGALVVAQAILDSADVCSARLERIADTLDDLVEAIERSTEGDEVPAC